MLASVVLKAPSGTGSNVTARRIDPPSGQNSGMPYLVNGHNGSAYISFIDCLQGGGHALRLTQWNGNVWTSPETIAQRKNWFVNWAGFPQLAIFRNQVLMAWRDSQVRTMLLGKDELPAKESK